MKSMFPNIKVQKDIPIPRDTRGRMPGERIAFLRNIKVGDSFVVHRDDAQMWRSIAYHHGLRITQRKEGKEQTRIWRTK